MQQLQELLRQVSNLPSVQCTCDLVYPNPDYCTHTGLVRKKRVEDMVQAKIDELNQIMEAENEGMTTE